jgi:hypothetical protein
LDTWTLDRLDEEIRRTFGSEEWVYTHGSVIQRVFAHDIYHSAELNETLARNGLPLVDHCAFPSRARAKGGSGRSLLSCFQAVDSAT